ncbi:MAG: Ig-like domain-containing protein [Candidatus Shapirobacteria bacterium]
MTKKMLFIILLILGLTTTLLLVTQTTIFRSSANNTDSHLPIKENSYLFASPIQAKADGKEQIRVTVFLLDSQGLGVSKQIVTLKVPSSIQVEILQGSTDDLGKATFNISSTTLGKFEISASTSTLQLSQKINLLFL